MAPFNDLFPTNILMSHLLELQALQLVGRHVELHFPVKVPVAVLVDGHLHGGLLPVDEDLDLAALPRREQTLEGRELANLGK